MTARLHRTPKPLTLAIVTLALGLLAASPVRGQPTDDGTSPAMPAAPVITPPRLQTFVEAKLPVNGPVIRDTVEVELELVIAADGTVTEAAVKNGQGSGQVDGSGDGQYDVFETAAVAAAKQLVFAPAERDGKPIPARIRYRYVFTPPPPSTGTLEGRVLSRELDKPVAGATITVESSTGSHDATSAVDGSFTIPELAPGNYHVTFQAPGMLDMTSDETITAGEATTLTVRLDAIPVAPQAEPANPSVLEFGATATVEAPPREVTKRTLQAEELNRVAGTRGDALRVVELMPGVARPPGAMGLVLIRGSAPEDSTVLMEGMESPRLYHFGGLTSFVQGRLLDRIDLYPGNFSARFGRKMGGVIDVSLRDPKSDGWHGMLDVNIIDASVLAEGPLTDKVSLALAFRRSYIDTFFAALANSTDLQVTAAPVYYDYQALLAWHPTSADRVRAFVYGSTDTMRLVLKNGVDSDPALRGNFGQETGFHRAQTQWRHQYSDRLEHEISLAVSPNHMQQNIGESLMLDVTTWEFSVRAEWRLRLGQHLALILGTDSNTVQGSISYRGPRMRSWEGDPTAFAEFSFKEDTSLEYNAWIHQPSAYLEAELTPTPAWRIVAGLRADYYSEIETGTVDPRLVSRYEWRPGSVIKGGVGMFSQPPQIPQSLRTIGNPDLRPAHAQHYSVGAEQKVGPVQASAELFHKRIDNMVVGATGPGPTLVNGGEGRVWGAELSLRSQVGARGFGFLSYTLSRSERNDHGEYWRRFDWDQPHILTASGSYRLGWGIELGGTFRFVSGNPYTPVVGSQYDGNLDLYRPSYGRVNSARNDAFTQLDVRIEKLWTRGWGRMALYLDVQNVTNRKNPEGRYYNFDYTQNRTIPGLPIIPSLGLRGEI